MAQNTDIFYNLNPEQDLEAATVKSKLEILVSNIPPRFRLEFDRSYFNGFSAVLKNEANSNESKKVHYFSENPQKMELHKIAY